jgi:hypothetical protein
MMARALRIAGGVALLLVTIGVVSAAGWALWLGAPLLDPTTGRVHATDIPVINTDSRIVRPRPSPQPGDSWSSGRRRRRTLHT